MESSSRAGLGAEGLCCALLNYAPSSRNEAFHTFPNPPIAAASRLYSSPGMLFSQELSVHIPGDSCGDKVGKDWFQLGPSCPYQKIQTFHLWFIPTRTVGSELGKELWSVKSLRLVKQLLYSLGCH